MQHPTHDTRLRRRRNPPGHHAREHPRTSYEQPPRRPRSTLVSGLSRRNPVLRYPTREYQPDRASRTRQDRRLLSRAQPPRGSPKSQPRAFTTTPPYQLANNRLPTRAWVAIALAGRRPAPRRKRWSTLRCECGSAEFVRVRSERGQPLPTIALPAYSGFRCSRNRSNRGSGSPVSISTAVPGQAFSR